MIYFSLNKSNPSTLIESPDEDSTRAQDLSEMVLQDQRKNQQLKIGKPMRTKSTINESSLIKEGNEAFKYTSFLRLRNLIFLCLMLRKNPSLKRYRLHYLIQVKEEEERLKGLRQRQTAAELIEEKIIKKFSKLKHKIALSNNQFQSIFRVPSGIKAGSSTSGRSRILDSKNNQDSTRSKLNNEDSEDDFTLNTINTLRRRSNSN